MRIEGLLHGVTDRRQHGEQFAAICFHAASLGPFPALLVTTLVSVPRRAIVARAEVAALHSGMRDQTDTANLPRCSVAHNGPYRSKAPSGGYWTRVPRAQGPPGVMSTVLRISSRCRMVVISACCAAMISSASSDQRIATVEQNEACHLPGAFVVGDHHRQEILVRITRHGEASISSAILVMVVCIFVPLKWMDSTGTRHAMLLSMPCS